MGARVGRLVGGWLGGWVAVVSTVGECFRACVRWSCYFLRYSILFSPLYLLACFGKVQIRTDASVCCCTAVAYGG